MRIALLLSSLALAACTVGEIGTSNNNGSGGPDAGSGSGSNMGTDPNACVDRLATPDMAHMHIANNATNAGMNCIVSGCHQNNTGGGPGFQFAGTIVKQGTTTPEAGAVVKIISNNMVVAQVYTDQAGNFSIAAGTLPGAFNASTLVTACPTVTKMVTPLVGGSGGAGANSCNSCHTTGSNAQAAPIYLQ